MPVNNSQRDAEPRTEAGRQVLNDFLNGPGGFGYAGITADDLRRAILAIEAQAATEHREPPNGVWHYCDFDSPHHLAATEHTIADCRRAVEDHIGQSIATEHRATPFDCVLPIPHEGHCRPATATSQEHRATLDVEKLAEAAMDVEAGYINKPDRTTHAYWRKIANRYAYLVGLHEGDSDQDTEAAPVR